MCIPIRLQFIKSSKIKWLDFHPLTWFLRKTMKTVFKNVEITWIGTFRHLKLHRDSVVSSVDIGSLGLAWCKCTAQVEIGCPGQWAVTCVQCRRRLRWCPVSMANALSQSELTFLFSWDKPFFFNEIPVQEFQLHVMEYKKGEIMVDEASAFEWHPSGWQLSFACCLSHYEDKALFVPPQYLSRNYKSIFMSPPP